MTRTSHPIVGGRTCLYCGTPGDTRDHYRPWVYDRASYTVPSCRECNMLLGDKVHPTLGDRALSVRDGLRRRYRKVLSADYENALEGTTGWLRAQLESERTLAAEVRRRLDWAGRLADLGAGVPLSDRTYLGELLATFLG